MKSLQRKIDELPTSLKLTRNQHIDYSDYTGSLILNNDLKQFLYKIDSIIMGSETEALKISPLSDLSLTTKIGLEVVKATMLETENEKDQSEKDKDIKELIQKHLDEILPKDDSSKDLILKLFPKDAKLTLENTLKEASNDLIAKACGFPSLTMFNKFINQFNETNSTLQMDIKYLLSLLSQSESLSSDGYLFKYKEGLRQYKMAKPGNNVDILPPNNKKQLDRIRTTVIRNIDYFYKYSPKKAESLSSFAERNGKHWKKFNKKEISAFKKIIYSSSSEQENLLANPSSYIPVSNCNLCPSLVKSEPNNKKKKKNMYKFATDWTAKMSVQKLTPIWDLEGVKRHWQAYHGPNSITHGSVL